MTKTKRIKSDAHKLRQFNGLLVESIRTRFSSQHDFAKALEELSGEQVTKASVSTWVICKSAPRGTLIPYIEDLLGVDARLLFPSSKYWRKANAKTTRD